MNDKQVLGLELFATLPLLLSFCNNEVLPLVNQLGTNRLSKHSFSCNLSSSCKLLKFFSQNSWAKSGAGDFEVSFSNLLPISSPVFNLNLYSQVL